MQEDEKNTISETPISAKLLEYTINARKIFLTGSIDEKMAKEVVQQLHILASINRNPIQMFITSPGGHVESGYMIFDAIRFINPRVIVIGSGWVASAGALIYVAADREDRYSLPNTRFLLHQPSGGVQGHVRNMEIYMSEMTKTREQLNKIFAEATGQAIEKIRSDSDRDFWLSAEEAVDYGLVHRIINSEKEIDNEIFRD